MCSSPFYPAPKILSFAMGQTLLYKRPFPWEHLHPILYMIPWAYPTRSASQDNISIGSAVFAQLKAHGTASL